MGPIAKHHAMFGWVRLAKRSGGAEVFLVKDRLKKELRLYKTPIL
jgi:hypothetical protein